MAGLRTGALIGLIVVGLLVGVLVGVIGCGDSTQQPPNVVAAWGAAGGRLGEIDHPEGLAVDNHGNLLVADTWNDRIVRTDGEGNVAGSFGERGTGDGQFDCPRSIAVDGAGNIYVVDSWNHRVQKFSPTGQFLLTFGATGEPWGYDEGDGLFVFPYGIAVDSHGYIYVSDFNNNRVQKFDPRGTFVMKWGTEGRQDGQFRHPAGLAIDSEDRLYVADMGNDRIERFTAEGEFDGKWGEPGTDRGTDPGMFDRPYSVCVNGEDNFYVADMGNHRVQKFNHSGHLLYVYGTRGTAEGEFNSPISVAADAEGRVYVSDWGNNRIQVLAPAS